MACRSKPYHRPSVGIMRPNHRVDDQSPQNDTSSVISRLQHWASIKPNDLALLFLADGENESCRLSYGELHDRAQRLSARIIRAGLTNQPILLMAQSGPEFVLAICGCLYAGAIAVPVPSLVRNRGQERIRSIVRDAGIAAMIGADNATRERLQELIPGIISISIEHLESESVAVAAYEPERPALLQYTSGSTSAPKGVIVLHRNLVTNIAMLTKAFGVHSGQPRAHVAAAFS